ncbi:MAG: hypothetical protein U0872_07830 [Planctomycetaceae bacterium]
MEARRFRLDASWLVVASFIGLVTSVRAEPPDDAELTVAIQKWKKAVSEIDGYQIHGSRIIRDHVFETEKWSRVAVYYRENQWVRLDFEPFDIPQGTKSRRAKGSNGEFYEVVKEKPSIWLVQPHKIENYIPGTGQQLFETTAVPATSLEKSADADEPEARSILVPFEMPLPSWQEMLVRAGILWRDTTRQWMAKQAKQASEKWGQYFGWVIIPEAGFPALFLVDMPGFEQDFDCTLSQLPMKEIRIDCVPRSPRWRDNFQSFSVILDAVSGRPTAQRTVDPSGRIETIVTFKAWSTEIVVPRIERSEWDFETFSLPRDVSILSHRWRK